MGIIARLKGEEPNVFKQIPHMLKGKGHYGEYLTEYALEHGDLGDVAVFSNVIVPRTKGPTSTSEIDVLMLHEKGIYVIESKNYSGWIFGSADQRNWTVSLNANTKERFYNPIKQNRSHIKALANHLGLEEEAFRSFIVFSERCELKKVPPDCDEYHICRRHHLLRDIRRDLDNREVLFDADKYAELRAEFESLSSASGADVRLAHVQEVQQVVEGNVCPLCGSELVERNGRYGKFIGCSAYPKCRFTRNV